MSVIKQRFNELRLFLARPLLIRSAIQRLLLVPPRPVRTVRGVARAIPYAVYAQNKAARRAETEKYLEWKEKFSTTRPILYWFTERLPTYYGKAVDYVEDKWYSVTNTLDNYFIQRADVFFTGIKRTDFDTADELMLAANFNQLELYIESVYATRYIRSQMHTYRNKDDAEFKKWDKINKIADRYPLLHFKKYRNKEYALKYIHSQIDSPIDVYDGPDEFRRYARIMSLYVWWTSVRPSRGSAYDVSGLEAYKTALNEKYGEFAWSFSILDKEEQEKYRELMHDAEALSDLWDQEDTEMLVLLVKERQNIWY
jgi:hypothetical protein